MENTSELAELREEIYRLKYQLTFAKPAVCSIPPAMLNQLIRLAHPDRHGNSQTANHVTAWLLAQRCNS